MLFLFCAATLLAHALPLRSLLPYRQRCAGLCACAVLARAAMLCCRMMTLAVLDRTALCNAELRCNHTLYCNHMLYAVLRYATLTVLLYATLIVLRYATLIVLRYATLIVLRYATLSCAASSSAHAVLARTMPCRMLYVSCCAINAASGSASLRHPALIFAWQQREFEATSRHGGHHRNGQLDSWLAETRSAQGNLDCCSQPPFNRCLVHLVLELGQKTWLSCELYWDLHEPDRCVAAHLWLHNKLGMSSCRSLVACPRHA